MYACLLIHSPRLVVSQQASVGSAGFSQILRNHLRNRLVQRLVRVRPLWRLPPKPHVLRRSDVLARVVARRGYRVGSHRTRARPHRVWDMFLQSEVDRETVAAGTGRRGRVPVPHGARCPWPSWRIRMQNQRRRHSVSRSALTRSRARTVTRFASTFRSQARLGERTRKRVGERSSLYGYDLCRVWKHGILLR